MIDERKTVKTTEICSCGLVFHTADENDYDTLGADSPVCCPDCGNEKFQTIEDLQSENERLRAALERIQIWSKAYPLKVFPKPDLKKVRKVLKAAGMTLDAISADAMRHVIDGVKDITEEALKG